MKSSGHNFKKKLKAQTLHKVLYILTKHKKRR